jgi:demethylmenaquinone methyltransferase / 2-methoxy-6-polyprenyl-1,4-benzoquinol methylase
MWKTQIAKIIDEGESIPTTILELAAGTGILSSMLDQMSDKTTVHSLDLTLDYLKKAREKHPTLSLINSTAELLPFKAETFDSIVSSYLAKYVDIETVVQESWQVLKHDGMIVFHDFTFPKNPVIEKFWKFHFLLLRLSGKLLKEWAPTFERLDKLISKTDSWPDDTIRYLRKTGFVKPFCKCHTLGTSAIVSARKP